MTFDPHKLHELSGAVVRMERGAIQELADYLMQHGEAVERYLEDVPLEFRKDLRPDMIRILHNLVKDLRHEVAH